MHAEDLLAVSHHETDLVVQRFLLGRTLSKEGSVESVDVHDASQERSFETSSGKESFTVSNDCRRATCPYTSEGALIKQCLEINL